MRRPQVSVIIPTFNRKADLALALHSIRSQKAKGVSFEVIVVDDGGSDGSEKAVKALARSWRALSYLRQANAGPGVARNLGALKAKGSLLAFMDDDAVAEPDWLAESFAALKAHPDWDGLEGAVLPQTLGPAQLMVHQVANTKGGQWLTCNLWVRRQAFLQLGGFDPRYRWIREHTEFAFRALDAGLQLPFVPASVVRHPALHIGIGRMIRDAKDGQYEALLARTHPARYRSHLKWIDGRAIPAYYLAHYAALGLTFFDFRLAALALGGGTAATLYAWCRKRRFEFSAFLKLAFAALFIPYLRLFWVAKGYYRYPQAPEA